MMSETLVTPDLTADVVRGKRGYWFLIGGAQKVLDYVSGRVEISPGHKRVFKDNLVARSAYCEAQGAVFRHIVCPDKQSVMREEFPFEVNVVAGQVMKDYCGDLFVFPVQEMRSGASEQVYWKTDTHWGLDGKLRFVREALIQLEFDAETVDNVLNDVPRQARNVTGFCGDLASKVTPREYEAGLEFDKPGHVDFYSNKLVGNNGTIQITINTNGSSGKLLIFGDSFAMGCLNILALFFKEILLVRSPYFHKEILQMFRPSHVLSANAERYLPRMPTDREAPLALLMPQLQRREVAPTAGFYECLNALLQPASLNYERFYSKADGATR